MLEELELDDGGLLSLVRHVIHHGVVTVLVDLHHWRVISKNFFDLSVPLVGYDEIGSADTLQIHSLYHVGLDVLDAHCLVDHGIDHVEGEKLVLDVPVVLDCLMADCRHEVELELFLFDDRKTDAQVGVERKSDAIASKTRHR